MTINLSRGSDFISDLVSTFSFASPDDTILLEEKVATVDISVPVRL
jgi:hypothetical protein